jgi:hypothetical protein
MAETAWWRTHSSIPLLLGSRSSSVRCPCIAARRFLLQLLLLALTWGIGVVVWAGAGGSISGTVRNHSGALLDGDMQAAVQAQCPETGR